MASSDSLPLFPQPAHGIPRHQSVVSQRRHFRVRVERSWVIADQNNTNQQQQNDCAGSEDLKHQGPDFAGFRKESQQEMRAPRPVREEAVPRHRSLDCEPGS